eukprot:Rhum_TRINITY_DN19567_c0_g1::Rhum_TRINITY_DN19567_c0_g1_i1::g.170233::m.170233
MSNKKAVLQEAMRRHLIRDVWARIGVSPAGYGVGVIAIRDIPQETIVDRVPASMLPAARRKTVEAQEVNTKDLAGVPSDVLSYLQEMYVETAGTMDVCRYGLNSFIGLAHFVNHSEEPNVHFVSTDDDEELDLGFNMKIQTLSSVRKGEELLCDYREYLSPEELARLPGMGFVTHDGAADAAPDAAEGVDGTPSPPPPSDPSR